MIKIAPVKFSIPKGSLEEATFKLLEESWTKVRRRPRTYRVFLDDPDIQGQNATSSRDSNSSRRWFV